MVQNLLYYVISTLFIWLVFDWQRGVADCHVNLTESNMSRCSSTGGFKAHMIHRQPGW